MLAAINVPKTIYLIDYYFKDKLIFYYLILFSLLYILLYIKKFSFIIFNFKFYIIILE